MAQESKYAYDEDSVKAIVHWALTAQLPAQIELSDINQHFPDPFYNPAIDRLYRLKEFIEK